MKHELTELQSVDMPLKRWAATVKLTGNALLVDRRVRACASGREWYVAFPEKCPPCASRWRGFRFSFYGNPVFRVCSVLPNLQPVSVRRHVRELSVVVGKRLLRYCDYRVASALVILAIRDAANAVLSA